jgi:hypothetical protein
MVFAAFSRLVAVFVLVVMLSGLAAPAAVSAAPFSPSTGVPCTQASDSTICQTKSTADPLTGSTGILHNVTRLIAAVAGAVAVIIMVLAGIRYMTSQGDAEQVSKAKKTIIFAGVGLLMIAIGQALINIVISKV